MKNILISSSAAPDSGSGISTYAKEISVAFRKRNYNIHYLSPTPEKRFWLKDNQINHIASDRLADMNEVCLSTLKYIKEHNIDGIINNDNPVITSIAPALKCPVVSVGHLEKYNIGALISFNADWMDYIVAISSDMKETYIRKFNIPITRCPIIHNGISKKSDDIINNGNPKLKILFAGGFSRRKGADLVLKMTKQVHPVWDHIELHWYGNLPDRFTRTVINNANVIFHGLVPRAELLNDLKKSDIFLMASREEGCPMSMLEAMSYGVVPITSNGRGAMRWLIDHGIHGYVCDIQDWHIQALDCIDTLHRNRKLFQDIRHTVLQHFNNNHLVDFTCNKILGLLSNPTVDRSLPKTSIDILQWHRRPKPSFYERLKWRLGVLKVDTNLNLLEVNQKS